jgi:endonuclease/exonuclease/phosphatase family metal-dependent hydrolase
MTWNVHGAARPDREALALAIRSLAPDVVALQEIRVGQAHRLANRLGLRALWVRKHFPLGPLVWWRAEGLAVLSRHPMTPAATWLLSPDEGTSTYRRRVAQRVEVTVGHLSVHLVNTHLASHATGSSAHPAGRTVRRDQATRLASLLAPPDSPLLPGLVLAGDLNSHDEPEVLAVFNALGLQDCWAAAATRDGLGNTSPSSRPDHRIDYVLAGPEWTVRRVLVPSVGTPESHEHAWAELSDHLPVVVDLER